VEVVSITDEGLGHSSHVVGLGDGSAIVIDPARFPTTQRRIADQRGWTLDWAADTHSHADYISGSPELTAEGAVFFASADAGLRVRHRGVRPGETIALTGTTSIRAIATPGHTPDHLAYLIVEGDQPVALFSGGSLMVGTVGRTDLLGDDRREDLARALFRSLRDEILELPDDLPVYPTHGAGSFCAAPGSSARSTTIGHERATNPFLSIDDENAFVTELLEGFGTFPPYFRELPERNRLGAAIHGRLPWLAGLDVDVAHRHVANGAVLVDARPIVEFATVHPTGAISNALRPGFASWLGWLVDLERPVVFIANEHTDRGDLVRQTMTIGHDAILGEVAGGIDAWRAAGLPTSSIPLVSAAELSGTILDVRQRSEWQRGHIPGAVHVELGAVRATALPPGPIVAMCGHGERAMTAASIITASGREDVSVLAGGPDDWSAATGGQLAAGR
jgi:glyoxylase-like metal-dependent hydrolase (beta-lactamase superfamily II)/rhodanese-related sulfurtransferase